MNGTVQLKQVNQLVPFCFTWDSSSDWPFSTFFLFSTIVANLVFPSFPQHTFLRFWYITIWKQGGGKGYRDRDKEEGLFWKLGNFVCSTDAILWEESLSSNSDLWRKWQISGMNLLNSYFWADVMGVQRPLTHWQPKREDSALSQWTVGRLSEQLQRLDFSRHIHFHFHVHFQRSLIPGNLILSTQSYFSNHPLGPISISSSCSRHLSRSFWMISWFRSFPMKTNSWRLSP